jgi:hypothetical protein
VGFHGLRPKSGYEAGVRRSVGGWFIMTGPVRLRTPHGGSKARLAARVAAMLACLVWSAFAAPAVALAATTWSGEFPMGLTTISNNTPTIQVTALNTSDIVSGNLTLGGLTLGTFTLQRPNPADLREALLVLDTSTYPGGLPWGENIVTASVRNSLGVTDDFVWTFYTDAPPVVSSVEPAAGDVVRTTTNPPIRVTVVDPDDVAFSNIVFRVNGSNAWGSLAYNYGYDAPTKTFTVQRKSAGWADGQTLNVEFRCDDAAGTASRNWSFRVDTRPDTGPPTLSDPMPAPGSLTSARPPFSITAIDNMPGDLTIRFELDGAEVYSQSRPQGVTSWTPPSDLTLSLHTVVAEAVDAAGNVGSQTWTFTASDPDSARHMTKTDFTACSRCHSAVVSTEHQNRGYACDAPCHTSTDPLITGAIDDRNTACEACHGPAAIVHGGVHDGGLPTSDCLACHNSNISAEHTNDCALCHTSTKSRVRAAIAAGDVRCVTCHGQQHLSGQDYIGAADPAAGSLAYVYLSWSDIASPTVTANTGSPHGGFTTTSIKCAVCHSVHVAAPAQSAAAPVADTLLRMKAADACGYCHVSKGNTVGNPIWGGDVRALAGANGHALGNNCDECHTSVHGGGAETEVASLEGKLLTLGTDYGTGSPGGNTTVLSRVAVINAKAVEQGFSNPTGFSVADYQTKYEADAPGITAQAVGVFCGGCHDASYSLAVSGASASTFGGQSSGMFSGHLSKGASVAGSSWNPVAGCTSCHDASDGFGGFAFPHNWGTTGEEAVIGPDGKTYENQTMGWLLVSEFAGAPKAVNGGPEGKLGHAGPDGGTLADGVCLKCHRGSAVTGVGLDF